MATITGRIHLILSHGRVVGIDSNFDDILQGTAASDTINGLGGNDVIFGGRGADVIDGGSGNDDINDCDSGSPAIGYWGHDTVHGGDGNDSIDYSRNLDSVTLYGDAGNDSIGGGYGNDFLSGGTGVDIIHGWDGNDTIDGGSGADVLYGGAGADTFRFGLLSNGLGDAAADRIADFKTGVDTIEWAVGTAPGYAESYSEQKIVGFGYDLAASVAQKYHHGDTFCFITDGQNGFLFADTDHNGQFDSSVTMWGLTSLKDFSGFDIIPG